MTTVRGTNDHSRRITARIISCNATAVPIRIFGDSECLQYSIIQHHEVSVEILTPLEQPVWCSRTKVEQYGANVEAK